MDLSDAMPTFAQALYTTAVYAVKAAYYTVAFIIGNPITIIVGLGLLGAWACWWRLSRSPDAEVPYLWPERLLCYLAGIIRSGISRAICFVLLAVLVARGLFGYMSDINASLDGLLGAPKVLPNLCNDPSSPSRLATVINRLDVEQLGPVAICRQSLGYAFATEPAPSLAISLSLSSDIVSNVSHMAVFREGTRNITEFATLGSDLEKALTGMRQLINDAKRITQLAAGLNDEWMTRAENELQRVSIPRVICSVVDFFLDSHACGEPTLPANSQKVVNASMSATVLEVGRAVTFTTKQRDALFAVHNQLSSLLDAVTAERHGIEAAESWVVRWPGALRRRLEHSRSIMLNGVSLRCVIETAMDALRRLAASINGLARAVENPSSKIAHIRMALGVLDAANAAVVTSIADIEQLLVSD
ncbi:hypothetical protein AURDEDRAFT_172134 [Auricularia subglabra TFB-10046 SS5]|nr:hypothetical protein AURDEDRAFT_172134 [Auricularia subglabra TFB-10046 SS5]